MALPLKVGHDSPQFPAPANAIKMVAEKITKAKIFLIFHPSLTKDLWLLLQRNCRIIFFPFTDNFKPSGLEMELAET